MSENDFSLQDLLKSALVYETNGISSLLVLSQGGREVAVEIEKSELHIGPNESPLQIYVPRDPRSQEFCFLSKLPPRLFDWMMTHPDTQIREKIEPEAVLVVTKILNAKLSSVDWLLEEAGIIEVAGTDVTDERGAAEQSDQDDSEDAEEEVLRADSPSADSLSDGCSGREALLTTTISETARTVLTPPTTAVPTTSVTPTPSSHPHAVSEVVHGHSRHRSAVAGSSPVFVQTVEAERVAPTHAEPPSAPDLDPEMIDTLVDEATRYLALLDNIIKKARHTSFPSLGSFNMSRLLVTLTESEISPDQYCLDIHAFRSATQRERDFKVGAAGELFVSVEC